MTMTREEFNKKLEPISIHLKETLAEDEIGFVLFVYKDNKEEKTGYTHMASNVACQQIRLFVAEVMSSFKEVFKAQNHRDN